MPYGELIIIDKVATVPTARSRKLHTSAPIEIGMAVKEDGENASQEGDQRIVDFALPAVYKGTDKGKWSFSKCQSWNEKGGKRWQRWREEFMAERQWQERMQRARERWQLRNQNMLVRHQ